METPSSMKRVTRSQTRAAVNTNTANSSIPMSRKIEESEKSISKSRRDAKQQDRSALIDITNDSPIVGLAMGSLGTPSSSIVKQRGVSVKNKTPGSGEALLRGQVKTLLQKVEEEAVLSKVSLDNRQFLHLNSPLGLLAPTPANTPQVPNLSHVDFSSQSVTPLPVVQEQLDIGQMVAVGNFDGKQESLESQKSLTRSLLLDFSEKSDATDLSEECSSVLTYQEEALSGESKDKSWPTDDDSASVWSMQVNTSSHGDEEDEEVYEEEEASEEDKAETEDENYDEDDDLFDELCAGIGKMSMNEGFAGKHTRFVYNSDDDEIVETVEDVVSPSVTRLKGVPTPKGKHLRFHTEDED
ncbi:hypothetical protein K2173_006108 [Erythroxylum novogranatense]|uniref:Chalcone-flavanone isomerase family protein n=1 Tax=Erythroxylum novogranatense TaxID=1862640 RepID=A0AAV8TCL3_9ROSI|nr:hypothetical protein K2173_006108 [Erythroxylum novogranatense]